MMIAMDDCHIRHDAVNTDHGLFNESCLINGLCEITLINHFLSVVACRSNSLQPYTLAA